jgi:hypothetical protein
MYKRASKSWSKNRTSLGRLVQKEKLNTGLYRQSTRRCGYCLLDVPSNEYSEHIRQHGSGIDSKFLEKVRRWVKK